MKEQRAEALERSGQYSSEKIVATVANLANEPLECSTWLRVGHVTVPL